MENLSKALAVKFGPTGKRIWKKWYDKFRDELGILQDHPKNTSLTSETCDTIAHNLACLVVWDAEGK